jgi:hypothetical protein
MARKMFKVAAGVATLLSLGAGGAGAANSAVSASATPGWQSVGPSGTAGEVTAVTTVLYSGGKLAEFAFVNDGDKTLPSMYSRSGSQSWALDTVSVAKPGEIVVSATAIGPNQVLLFTRLHGGGGRVIEYTAIREKVPGGYETGAKFTVLKTFSAGIGSASVLSASDVWVFGSSAAGAGKLGVWHYNGATWKQVSASAFTNGSAESNADVWAISDTTMEHYNGSKWTATSLASLLPAKSTSSSPSLTTVTTGEDYTTYAIGSGNSKIGGGPVVVLEYNGHAWVKVATYPGGNPVPGAASADGGAGLWFPVYNGAGKPAELVHYVSSTHSISATTVPGLTDSAGSDILAIANVSGSTKELAGGYILHPAGNPTTYVKVDYYN